MWTPHLKKWGSIDPLDPVAARPLSISEAWNSFGKMPFLVLQMTGGILSETKPKHAITLAIKTGCN